MQIISFDDLYSEPGNFIGEARRLVIASYGQVDGYEDGKHEKLSVGGRAIEVIVGGGMFNGFSFGPFSFRDPDIAGVQASKDAGLKIVERELSDAAPATFVVLYAGTSRLHKIIDLGISITERGAKVALLSCGCDDPSRFARVEDAPVPENILVVMPSNARCDSEARDLGRLASKFMEL